MQPNPFMTGKNMSAIEEFEKSLNKSERQILKDLTNPRRIQDFLDGIAYSVDKTYRCPVRVLRERMGHCFDGAIFAAAALYRLGYPPLVLDMRPNHRDDDHTLALYKRSGHWGAVAKSNFVGLRFREPIYRTLRELVMSYFEQYYNVAGEKTLRAYTRPLNLSSMARYHWLIRDEAMERIARRLDEISRVPLLTRGMIAGLSKIDEVSYRVGLMIANPAGLYQPVQKLRKKSGRTPSSTGR